MTIREALKEIYETRSYYDSEEWTDLILNIVVTSVDKLKKTEYPEFHTIHIGSENTTPKMSRHDGYNQALKEVRDVLNKS